MCTRAAACSALGYSQAVRIPLQVDTTTAWLWDTPCNCRTLPAVHAAKRCMHCLSCSCHQHLHDLSVTLLLVTRVTDRSCKCTRVAYLSRPSMPWYSADVKSEEHLEHVGLVVWQSAFVLAEYLLRHPPFGQWDDVHAVDLGAGTGEPHRSVHFMQVMLFPFHTAPFTLHHSHCTIHTAPFALHHLHCTICTALFTAYDKLADHWHDAVQAN